MILEKELKLTTDLLGPLPDSISLEKIADHCENLHGIALKICLELCRDQKSYSFLQHFHDRLLSEKRFEEWVAGQRGLSDFDEAKRWFSQGGEVDVNLMLATGNLSIDKMIEDWRASLKGPENV